MSCQFQSRNRETFDFNAAQAAFAAFLIALFQSRNRETFDFNESKLIL